MVLYLAKILKEVMAYPKLEKASLDFLKDLEQNNNREWFAEHKHRYEDAKQNWKDLSIALMEAMNEVDQITDYKVWRIYRDVRFSKDKTPYNTHFSLGLTRQKPNLRGGYYLRVNRHQSSIAGGFWAPNKDDLKRIRQEIDTNPVDIRRALSDNKLKENFGELYGDQVKSAPRGYAKDNPNIDLLKYKQFILHKPLTQKQITGKDFIPLLVESYQAMRPFFNVMTDILTTDENGAPLY